MQYKSIDAEIVRGAEGERKDLVSFIASTASPDRYGDVINQKGWSLAKYRKNPVILLNHNANQLPIGRGEVDVIDGKLMVDIEFDMEDPIGAEVARKTKDGFMSAVSVGFNPIESTPRSMLSKDDPYYAPRGEYFDSAELLEISIVTIPANGEAVAAKSLNIKDLVREELQSLLKSHSIKELIQKDSVEIEAPEGHHWMDYEGGPVLMVGEDADHAGGSKTFRFEVIEEHDPDRMKRKEPEEPEEQDGHHDDDKDDMSYHDDDKDDMSYHDEDSEDSKDKEMDDDKDKEKHFLTTIEREFYALFTNEEK